MKKKSWVEKYWWVLIIVGMVILTVPRVLPSIISILMNEPKTCTDTPYASICYCPEGYDRKELNMKYYCDPKELFIDVNEPMWRDTAYFYAKTQFSMFCPECDVSCSDGSLEMGYMLLEQKIIIIECRVPLTPTSGYISFDIEFPIDSDGMPHDPSGYCLTIQDIRCKF